MILFEELVKLLEVEYLEKRGEYPDHARFRKKWEKAKTKFLEKHGWDIEWFDTELDRRQKRKTLDAGINVEATETEQSS